MPDSTSRSDDPFADLFGKLPDPRTRADEAPGPRRTPPADPESAAGAPGEADTSTPPPVGEPSPAVPTQTKGAAGPATGALPLSRRAAREAIQGHSGESPTALTRPTDEGSAEAAARRRRLCCAGRAAARGIRQRFRRRRGRLAVRSAPGPHGRTDRTRSER